MQICNACGQPLIKGPEGGWICPTCGLPGVSTTVQEVKGKYTTPIPSAIIKLRGIEKSNKLKWSLKGDVIVVVIRATKK